MATGLAPIERASGVRQTKKGRATRDQLLASSIRLVATIGYGATTTQAVLDDSGLSRGSLLHQFPTREVLMVATAEAAMAQMLSAIETRLRQHEGLLAGMQEFPMVMWQVQNELPARAFSEIQLASRWDAALAEGLKHPVGVMNDLLNGKIAEFAAQFGIRDVAGLSHDIHLQISATQGLAIGQHTLIDPAATDAALSLLRSRFITALAQRISVDQADR